MRIGITCIQLIRDLDDVRPELEAAGFELTVPDILGQHLEGDELIAALEGCVGVVAGDDRFSAEVIDRLPDLRAIAKWGIGVDGIDFDAAEAVGIEVTNTPGEFADEVADVTIGYLIMLARGLHIIDRGVRKGIWPKPVGRSLRGSTLGIVGLGSIGRAVAKRGAFLGMEVLGSDPSTASVAASVDLGVEALPFEDLLGRSDFLAVTAPHNDSTHHLLDEAAFRRMRQGVWIVNTGRGPVIETAALVDALERGVVAGVAVDVLEEEPPGLGHPMRRFEQVIFGSHNASNTLEASARVHRRALANLAASLGIELRLT